MGEPRDFDGKLLKNIKRTEEWMPMRESAGGEVYERGNTNGTNIANEGAYYVRVIYILRYVCTYAKRRMQHMGAMMPLRKRKGTTATCADSRRK